MIPITNNTNITCNDPTPMIDDQTWTRTGVESNKKTNTLQISIISDNARSHGIVQRVGHLVGSHSDMLFLSFNNNSSTHSTTTNSGTTKCKEDLRWAESSSSLSFLDDSNRSSNPSGMVLSADNEAPSSFGEQAQAQPQFQPPNLPSRQSSLVVYSPEPTKTTKPKRMSLMRESEAHISQSQLQDKDDIPHRSLSAFHTTTTTTTGVGLRSGPAVAATAADASVPKLPVRRLSKEPGMSDSEDEESISSGSSSSSTYEDQDFTRSPLQRVDSRELTFLTMRSNTHINSSPEKKRQQQLQGQPRTQRRHRGTNSSSRQRASRVIQDACRLLLVEDPAQQQEQPNEESILDNPVSSSCPLPESGNTAPALLVQQEANSQD